LITKFGVFLGALGQANMGWQAMKKSIGGIVGGIWNGLKYLMKWPIQLAKAAAMKAGSLLGFGGGAAKAATSVASTAASTTANVAGSVAKGGGMASMAAGLAAFANPATLLGLAAVTAAIIGIGFALRIAAPGIEAFGKAVASIVVAVGEVVGNLIGAITTSIVTLMDNVTLEKVGAIALLSLAFLGLAGSLYLLGSAGIFALPALLGIAAASAGLVMVAEILGIGGESSSEETGALEEGSMSEYQKNVILELQTLQDVMRKGLIVNLDGTKVNRGIQAADNRSLSNSVIQ
jgi:hypothetical protein